MTDIAGKIIGVYHFISDKAPGNIPLVDPKPRTLNPWRDNGRVLLARTMAGEDIRASLENVIALLGHLSTAVKRGDRVFIKPNFNSWDPFPASTDLSFLRAVIQVLLEQGARVTVGDSAGGIWRPTRNVFHRLGLFRLAREMGIEIIAFDDMDDGWVRVRINGNYLGAVTVPRPAYEADRIIYLPCARTHNLARFSGALKISVGFMHPGERRALHASHLEQKVAEINLCWQPDLILMDARKAFVSGGPSKGELVAPGMLLASGDLIAIDVEAMKTLLSYPANNRLSKDPWQSQQIVTAVKHGLGVAAGGYKVID